jgi:hypothetical protein
MRVRVPILTLLVLALGLPALPAAAQGPGTQTLNFEPPVHKPIQVVRVGTRDFLLVANVSDDSVEIYDTAGPTFLFRVPTGQAPVTIAVRPRPTASGGRQVYTANWLGDSVTVFDLIPAGAGLTFRLVTTEPVGDEPVGLAFLPENPAEPGTLPGGPFHELVLVTSSSRGTWGVFLPGSMLPVLPAIELLDPTSGFGVKDPRALAFSPVTAGNPNRMWILNHRGGNDPAVYDFDLWGTNNTTFSAGSGRATQPILGGLGTTNFQMTFLPSGDLWVVGQRARNKDPQLGSSLVLAVGEPVHQNQVLTETGFVTSYVARVRNIDTAPAIDFLDLNDASQGTATPPTQATVPVTQPTDVVGYPDGSRIFVTGYNSDTVAAIRPGPGGPATWAVARASVAPPGPISVLNPTGGMRGPRGLALLARGAAPAAGDRLYVYNRVDNSVSVMNPLAAVPTVLANFPLRGQVEPAYVVTGRKFLYSSRLSGTGVAGVGGNVSCASCHIDGDKDHLSWNLSDGGAIPAPFPSPPGLPGSLGPNAAIKGQMFTQSLRGLVNFEVLDGGIQDLLYSNKPYHWRGDKGAFEHFNAAFVNLMGAPNRNPGAATPAFNEGIPPLQMTEYRNFTFSMHYPPNPDQPFDRVYSGALGNAGDVTTGSGGQLGLKTFHILASDLGVLSCVHCHLTPEGSNNRFTEALGNINEPTFPAQALETAALRGLVTKEKRLQRVVGGAFVPIPGPAAVTGEFGLTHTGLSDGIPGFGSLTINDFVNGFGLGILGGNPALPDAMALYMREFDNGVAPLVGFTASTDPARFNADPVGQTNAVLSLEPQVNLANASLAIHARVQGLLHGFWFDPTHPTAPYREEIQIGVPVVPGEPFSTAQLLDIVRTGTPVFAADNLLTFHFTPLGAARRVARVQGGLAPPLATVAPGPPTSLAARTNTANAAIPTFTQNWANLITAGTFFPAAVGGIVAPHQLSTIHYQKSLVNWVPGGFGLAQLRHEAPRRFRITGPGIGDGAFLVILEPIAADIATVPAGSGSPPTTTPTAATNPLILILPLHPTFDGTAVAWETAEEMEPLLVLALMNGGTANPVAVTAFLNPFDSTLIGPSAPFSYLIDGTNLMDPVRFNWHFVQIANATPTGFQFSAGSWQRLMLQ